MHRGHLDQDLAQQLGILELELGMMLVSSEEEVNFMLLLMTWPLKT